MCRPHVLVRVPSLVCLLTGSEDAVNTYGPTHNFTKLCINHEGIDPDDAFSTVAYEKGFHMVYMLDRLVGRENFDKFIPYYFTKWSRKSLDSFEFRDTFLEFFGRPEYAHLKDGIASIDWESRFYTPGMPPKPEFDTSLIDVCYQVAAKWKSKVGALCVCASWRRLFYCANEAPGLHPCRG